MRAVLLSARARVGTGEVLAKVRQVTARHAQIVGEFDVNEALPPTLHADRAVVVGGDGSIMAALRQFVDRAVPVVGVNIGRLGGKAASIDLDFLALRRIEVIGVTFRTRTADETIACVQACARDLLPAIDAGEITPVVDRVFDLSQAGLAAQHRMSDAQIGKIALEMS